MKKIEREQVEESIRSIGRSLKVETDSEAEQPKSEKKEENDEAYIRVGKDGKAECKISEDDLKKYKENREDKTKPLLLKMDCNKKWK